MNGHGVFVCKADMQLCVSGKWTRKKSSITRVEASYLVKSWKCDIEYLRCGIPCLVILVEVYSEHSGRIDTMQFKLIQDVQVVFLFSCYPLGDPYPYHIRWILSGMLYTLKTNKLDMILKLISFNNIFNIKHISNGTKLSSYLLL